MKKTISIVLIILLAVTVFGEEPKTLGEQLRDRALPCFEWIKNEYNEQTLKDSLSVVDDSKNGYLTIHNELVESWVHEHIVKAYRNKEGEYTFLEKENWDCSAKYKLSSNRPLKEILPENFGAKTFMPKLSVKNVEKAFFYLDADIPRKGTDTIVSIKSIPFGTSTIYNDILCFEHPGKENENSKLGAFTLRDLLNTVQDANVLQFLLDAEYEKISKDDVRIIYEMNGLGTMSELTVFLKELKYIYDLSTLIEYKAFVLGWDANKTRFFIKSKIKAEKIPSFREFLLKSAYISPFC